MCLLLLAGNRFMKTNPPLHHDKVKNQEPPGPRTLSDESRDNRRRFLKPIGHSSYQEQS